MTVKTNPDKELVRYIREQLKAEDGYLSLIHI